MTNESTTEPTEGKTEEPKADDQRAGKKSESSKSSGPHRIMLVPYPKFIFMYPTLIVSVLAAIVLSIREYSVVDPASQTLPVMMTGLFLVFFVLNTFIIVFDFPRATSLTLVFIATTSTLGGWLLMIGKPDLLPSVQDGLTFVRPEANASFFVCISVAMVLMYVAIFIKVRFNYWELRNNELLHHHGFLSDLKRYPAPNLRVDKEINDVFEFMLLGAGRLILHPTTEKRAIVLDNILFVSGKEKELTRVLGSIKVQVGNDSNH
ncbi:hypothetical protein N9D23_03315 [Rubripirellula sp.]|nr:hypothetical protein [Rubripirellula sp.]